jgi:hypothetical protein
METYEYGKVDVYVYIFLSSALVEGEWSDFRPVRLTPTEKTQVPI